MIFKISAEHIGRNGFTRRDIGKWAVMDTAASVFYTRRTEHEARELIEILRGNK